MTEDLRVILVGFGVVGKALSGILSTRHEELRREHGFGIKVVAIADAKSSTTNDRGLDLRRVLAEKEKTGSVGVMGKSPRPAKLIKELAADILVELTPGNPIDAEPGLSHIRAALASKTNVVTANKMPIAIDFPGLVEAAARRGLALKYGACVGAGLPLLDFGETCAESETVVKIDGVLNATSNFILSRMEESGTDFRRALEEAKKMGYAETNPWLDIDGIDAACKIVILADHVMGRKFTLKDVKLVEGIRRISLGQIKEVKRREARIRMVAEAERGVGVHVMELPRDDALAVMGACNAVRFQCRYSGARIVMGQAAGGMTTSSAILRDMLGIGRSIAAK